MRGAPVGVLEGYGARRLGGGCGGGGSRATGHPVRDDRERRGRARRRAMAPVRGAAPPLLGHGSEGRRISLQAQHFLWRCCFARGEAESGMEREERGRGI